ncbi:hypothetical protein BD410DRAFT_840634 [Rickenella mellea]|uniref:Ribonuclease H1 N-terminal domain-containing protein n=1 Tax=Rickenella mellea TaxID=50990 RepID=A0A4Y7Q1C8_9AGAM|nr:hypothetical protein BD410DRAFT_840634 [Rickenella mellea]
MPKDSDAMEGISATETPKTPQFSTPDDQFHVENPYPLNLPVCTPSSQASQWANTGGADNADKYNPFFAPNLPVNPFSSPGRRNKPIIISSSPLQRPIVISSSPPQPPIVISSSQPRELAGEADPEDEEDDDDVQFYYTPSGRTLKGPWYAVTKGTETGVFRGWALTTTFVTGVGSAAFTRHVKEIDAYKTYLNALERKIVKVL